MIELLSKCKPGFKPTGLFWLLVIPLLITLVCVAMAGFWFVSTQMNVM